MRVTVAPVLVVLLRGAGSCSAFRELRAVVSSQRYPGLGMGLV